VRRIGPIYDLHPGLRLWDVEAGCGACSKRLAEVVEDVSGQWLAGQLVCIDCGTVAPAYDKTERPPWRLRTSWRAPGKHVAACQLCPYVSMPSSLEKAAEWAEQHLAAAHSGTAA
jgi:transcription initiation factor TFIIIB Brf1 subunit/transcription initiation factor TFIIB